MRGDLSCAQRGIRTLAVWTIICICHLLDTLRPYENCSVDAAHKKRLQGWRTRSSSEEIMSHSELPFYGGNGFHRHCTFEGVRIVATLEAILGRRGRKRQVFPDLMDGSRETSQLVAKERSSQFLLHCHALFWCTVPFAAVSFGSIDSFVMPLAGPCIQSS